MADDATTFTFLSAVGSATAGSAFNFSGVEGVQIQVWSASTSSSTVQIEGSENGSIWVVLASIADVALAGEVWEGSAMKYMRVNPAVWASGAISALGHTLDHDPGAWHKVAHPTQTPVALTAVALTVANLTDSGLTITRVPYASTAGLLIDAAAFNYVTATGALSAAVFAGGSKDTIAAKSSNGAIASAPGTIVITKGSILNTSTLATPTTTDHDGYILRIVSSTAYAHVISVASGKVNGGSNTTMTFAAAAGNSITLIAYQGVWYTLANIGVTIT